MDFIRKEQLDTHILPGRYIWKAIGKDSMLKSEGMTIGFARFSAEIGAAETHQHAEESIYVLEAHKANIHWGDTKEELAHHQVLERGMLLRIPAQEWHVFVCGEDGYLDILFFYGQVDNIRPEERNERNL